MDFSIIYNLFWSNHFLISCKKKRFYFTDCRSDCNQNARIWALGFLALWKLTSHALYYNLPYLKAHLREAFANLNSPGDQLENVHILKKSENSQKNHSNPNNIENSIVDQSGDHVESVHILQALSKNTHENHSDPKINQNFFESDCEKIQNLADKESKTSQENHSDSKRTKGQLISKYPFGVIVFTKIPTKNLTNFCPRI